MGEKKTSKVYFADLEITAKDNNMNARIKWLFDKADFASFIKNKELTAIKVHFGEQGNTSFNPPWNIKPIIDKVKAAGGKPYLTDTSTLYIGHRKNAVDHHIIAAEHGFTYGVVGCPVIMADGLTGKNFIEYEINKKHFKKVKIATDFHHANSMIVVSHFKGHIMAGFGGAIKNLAMGCASAGGKKEQHSVRPQSDHELCTGCGICAEHCPVDCITFEDGKSIFDGKKCIGCGECIANCPEEAVTLNWETEIPDFTERLTEYAFGANDLFKGKIGFITFLVNVIPDCDCMAWSGAPVVRDIGILASTDPLALDKACYDLVNQQHGIHGTELKCNFNPGEDKFKGINNKLYGEIQLNYGEELGLGNLEYELIKYDPENP